VIKHETVVVHRPNGGVIRIGNVLELEEDKLNNELRIKAFIKGQYAHGVKVVDYTKTYKFYLDKITGYHVKDKVVKTEEEII